MAWSHKRSPFDTPACADTEALRVCFTPVADIELSFLESGQVALFALLLKSTKRTTCPARQELLVCRSLDTAFWRVPKGVNLKMTKSAEKPLPNTVVFSCKSIGLTMLVFSELNTHVRRAQDTRMMQASNDAFSLRQPKSFAIDPVLEPAETDAQRGTNSALSDPAVRQPGAQGQTVQGGFGKPVYFGCGPASNLANFHRFRKFAIPRSDISSETPSTTPGYP